MRPGPCGRRSEAALDIERAARRRHAEEAAGLEALREAVGAEAQVVMRQVRKAEDGIDTLVREAEAARTAQHTAIAGTGRRRGPSYGRRRGRVGRRRGGEGHRPRPALVRRR